ncbi:MAG: hypothetical protein QUS08_07995 [Methanothrix sp.]|nr:hypothetical protein [Methanothrix sp.]
MAAIRIKVADLLEIPSERACPRSGAKDDRPQRIDLWRGPGIEQDTEEQRAHDPEGVPADP